MDGSDAMKDRKQGAKGVPFALTNIRLFILFRVLFNARFYYPVFTVLFLDYGLTLEQFAFLNAVWAATIVLAEVPSGALADLLGRRLLLVVTSLLMIAEMLLIGLVPVGDPGVVFWAFFANRVLSGLAEALASGADEALAYDTLVAHGCAGDWPRVLEVQMRAQHFGYMVAMTLGAVVYDVDAVNRLLDWMALPLVVDQQTTMRFPILLTLLFGLLALAVTLRMREPHGQCRPSGHSCRPTPREVTRLIGRAAGWIVRTPMALAIILFAMTFDHTLRMVVTLASKYYRLIDLPDASFGLLGSAVAVIGLFVPGMARIMAERFSPGRNALLLGVASLSSLALLTLFVPYFGLMPMVAVFVCLMLTSFFTSHYLNRITVSEQRATVLSFKGLAFNAAYGAIGLVFAGLVNHSHGHFAALHPEWPQGLVEDQAFKAAMGYLPWYLLLGLILVCLVCLPRLVKTGQESGPP